MHIWCIYIHTHIYMYTTRTHVYTEWHSRVLGDCSMCVYIYIQCLYVHSLAYIYTYTHLGGKPTAWGGCSSGGVGRCATREICVSHVHVSDSPSCTFAEPCPVAVLCCTGSEAISGTDVEHSWRRHKQEIAAPSGRLSVTSVPFLSFCPTSWCLPYSKNNISIRL